VRTRRCRRETDSGDRRERQRGHPKKSAYPHQCVHPSGKTTVLMETMGYANTAATSMASGPAVRSPPTFPRTIAARPVSADTGVMVDREQRTPFYGVVLILAALGASMAVSFYGPTWIRVTVYILTV